jgi:DNA replication protein DnaC
MSPDAIDVEALLRRLHLPTMRRLLPVYAEKAAAEGVSHRDFLALLCAEEVANRNNTRIAKYARRARFPALKTIEEYDFTFQSSLKRTELGPFLDPDFVAQGRNLILLGPGFITTTRRSAPRCRIGTLSLASSSPWLSPLASAPQVPTFRA